MKRLRTLLRPRGNPGPAPVAGLPATHHPGLAQAQELGARLPPLLVAAERVAATVAQGVHGRRRAGMGDSFWQYRQAMPGEAASRIDWRQSARTSRAFVRETEWEAAQSVFLWHDRSASMRWRSARDLPLKAERAELLLLALASLLLRGGEHVRLLEAPGARMISGHPGLPRLVEQMLAQASIEQASASRLPDAAGLPACPVAVPRHARVVLIGDMLAETAETDALLTHLAAIPVGCTVLQVLDPAELSLPYRGRTRFEGLEGEPELLVAQAEDLRGAYRAAVARHGEHLAALCSRAGFGLIRHRTDEPPEGALLALHQALHGALSVGAVRASALEPDRSAAGGGRP